MTLTLLFDLDDTLLNTNMGEFLPEYFNALCQALSHLGSREKIYQQVHYAVSKMVANQNPGRKLKDVFVDNFYAPLGTTEAGCSGKINAFYAEEFPKLKALTTPKPEVLDLIHWCKSQNFRMAIATDPLFPETATRQRIEWAGLNPTDFCFFSSYNDFHFTKPNLTYYAEILGRLGWPDNQIVMIGDNLAYDLLPVEIMGYKTFFITPESIELERPSGSLSDVQSFLQNFNIQKRNADAISNAPEVQMAVLRATPAVIDTWLENNSAATLHQKPADGGWSMNEVFWHLTDFEEKIYQPQWQQVISEPEKILPHIETSEWSDQHGYSHRDPKEAGYRFLESRIKSLDIIEQLWNKGLFDEPIHHSVFSRTSIKELVGFSAKHDRLHLQQCANLLEI